MTFSIARFAALALLCRACPLIAQSPSWEAGIAEVKARNRSPGTGFVVAVRSGRAWLVTSAHVVTGDPNPEVVFVSDPDGTRFKAEVSDQEAEDPRGLALLVVANPPASIHVIEPGQDVSLTRGASVTVAGFPVVIGRFTVLPASVTAIRGRELFLAPETGEGFSGGPVLVDGRVVGAALAKRCPSRTWNRTCAA